MTTTNEHGCHFSAENKNRGGKKKSVLGISTKRLDRVVIDFGSICIGFDQSLEFRMTCAYHKTLVFALLFCRATGH